MASKNISITNDVYDELKKIRFPDESFSNVIHRLIAETQKDPMKSFGALKNIPEKEWNMYEKCFISMKEENLKAAEKKKVEVNNRNDSR